MNKFQINIRPAEYLKDGLVDETGNLREGINGEYSLAVAYQLRDEGYKPEEFKEFRERIGKAVESFVAADAEVDPEPISDDARSAIREMAKGLHEECELVEELIGAAEPQLTDWRSFALLMDHMERINAQLALLVAHTS